MQSLYNGLPAKRRRMKTSRTRKAFLRFSRCGHDRMPFSRRF
jgi:hypothetical protein